MHAWKACQAQAQAQHITFGRRLLEENEDRISVGQSVSTGRVETASRVLINPLAWRHRALFLSLFLFFFFFSFCGALNGTGESIASMSVVSFFFPPFSFFVPHTIMFLGCVESLMGHAGGAGLSIHGLRER